MKTNCSKDVTDSGSLYITHIAGALATSRNAFPDDIAYEVNGDMLTWIVRGYDSEYRIECHNASEVVDGFYRAEYFLDTSKLLDPYTEFHAGIRYVEREKEREPNVIVSQVSVREALRMLRRQRKLAKLNEELDAEERETPGSSCKEAASAEAGAKKDGLSTRAKAVGTEPFASSRDNHASPTTSTSECIRIMNNARDVCEETMKVVLNSRKAECVGHVENSTKAPVVGDKSQNEHDVFESGVIKREIRVIQSGVMFGRRKRQGKDGDHTPDAKEVDENASGDEKVADDSANNLSVRRGKRARKGSVFQDYYLPIANNEWIAETFIKPHKMAY
ncbi:hypothetical protein BgAZ_205450 [Babesia gibsoni]|uniref:Uncharacterized protein n=1 Tax=Babesia gibsoni TaxID=33632 RepID=A0AAD8LK12_BABGI|nr:hypothetical protein BgAZ_205450 [Babesia gibsoni]